MKNIILYFVLFILGIQAVRINKDVPIVDPKGTFDVIYSNADLDIRQVKLSCYNCHSYETKYPWYANIAPSSWFLKMHVDKGRDELNFSIWNSYSTDRQKHKLEEIVEMLQEKAMPLKSYTWLHKEAMLTNAKREELIAGFQKLLSAKEAQ